MKNETHRGFIPAIILLTVFIGAVFVGGVGYGAYEIGKSSKSEKNSAGTDVSAVGTTTATIATSTTKETSLETKDVSLGGSGRLEAEAQELEKVIETESLKTNNYIITLPNGAVVEMDASGQIVRYITQPVALQEENNTSTNVAEKKTEESITISSAEIAVGVSTGRIAWGTNKPTNSKIFISAETFPEKAFESESGLSTKHYVNLIDFDLSADLVYSYEIEAINSTGEIFEKKTGQFKLLNRPYTEILAEVKPHVEFNPDKTCSQLYLAVSEMLVCWNYRAGL